MCVEALVVQKSRSIDLTFNNLTLVAPLCIRLIFYVLPYSKQVISPLVTSMFIEPFFYQKFSGCLNNKT